MRTAPFLIQAAACAFLLASAHAETAAPVIVHEWGTFTSLQDEQGQAIGGINVDDEPVPSFVHGVGSAAVAAQYSSALSNFGLPPYNAGKGWTAGDPAVTMRLETPVIYIYPPKGQAASSVPPLQVHVDFHGGVLSQFYPYADTTGLPLNQGMRGMAYLDSGITAQTTTGLTWTKVRLGSGGKSIASDDKVWTTPRKVSAPPLSVAAPVYGPKGPIGETSETEHFLFYRGIGHLDSPLRLGENVDGFGFRGQVGTRLHYQIAAHPDENAKPIYTHSWLVDIRPDHTCAFRSFGSLGELKESSPSRLITKTDSFFASDFHPENLTALKASMQAALVQEGLYSDEASAMLRTWDLSYFKSPGLRFFYTVPRQWTDSVLPLRITGAPARITRVMIGRIEMITDAQRAALHRLAAGPCPNLPAFKMAAAKTLESGHWSKQDKAAFYAGERPLTDLGLPIPPLLQDYLSLGRFRDALVTHENQQHPTPALAQFIHDNGLNPDFPAGRTTASTR